MIVANTARYWAPHDERYWEDALTLRLHRAHQREHELRPPLEELAALYFRGQEWLPPPSSTSEAQVDDQQMDIEDIPDFSL